MRTTKISFLTHLFIKKSCIDLRSLCALISVFLVVTSPAALKTAEAVGQANHTAGDRNCAPDTYIVNNYVHDVGNQGIELYAYFPGEST